MANESKVNRSEDIINTKNKQMAEKREDKK